MDNGLRPTGIVGTIKVAAFPDEGKGKGGAECNAASSFNLKIQFSISEVVAKLNNCCNPIEF